MNAGHTLRDLREWTAPAGKRQSTGERLL